MKRALALTALAILVALAASCVRGDSSTDTDPLPNTGIWDAWWGDTCDYDADGYTSYRRLYFDLDVRDGTARTVYATIEYASSTAGSWYPYYIGGYATTDTFTVVGMNANDAYFVGVGLPNPELQHNSYDFRISVYDYYTDALVGFRDEASDMEDLNNQRFETDAEDPTEVFIFETYWYDTLDYDNDGYFRYGRLTADIDAVDGVSSYWVYLRVLYRPSGSSGWSVYHEMDTAWQITGTSADDALYVGVGAPNMELSPGPYDFLVQLYRTDTPTLQDWLGPADEPEDLQQWYVEPASQDLP